MLTTVYRTIQKYDLLPSGSSVLVGVSGGTDSLALMHVLYTLRSSHRCIPYVATLDHKLRGEAGAEDAEFVVKLAKEWGLPTVMGSIDVSVLAEREGIGIEAAARLARYNFLAESAEHFGVNLVAVAHHIGDQAETVLMHLIRGAGLHGLGGMTPKAVVPGHPHLRLIRPLLEVTRGEIEAYCREYGLMPRQDATNEDTAYLRNYLRHETLPHLERLNPKIQRALAQLAETVQTEDDYLHQALQEFIDEHGEVGGEFVLVSRTIFRSLHPALQRRFIIWGAHQIRSELESLSYSHIVKAVQTGLNGQQNAIALLTKGVRLRVEYDKLFIEHVSEPLQYTEHPLIQLEREITIHVPSETVLPGGHWTLIANLKQDKDLISSDVAQLVLPTGSRITLRSRREGDRFRPLGLGGHSQKLNRWMINRKIPQRLRGTIPLICVNDEIAAISMEGQWFISERYSTQGTSGQVAYFHFKKNL